MKIAKRDDRIAIVDDISNSLYGFSFVNRRDSSDSKKVIRNLEFVNEKEELFKRNLRENKEDADIRPLIEPASSQKQKNAAPILVDTKGINEFAASLFFSPNAISPIKTQINDGVLLLSTQPSPTVLKTPNLHQPTKYDIHCYAVAITNSKFEIMMINDVFESLFGLDKVVGSNMMSILPDKYAKKIASLVQQTESRVITSGKIVSQLFYFNADSSSNCTERNYSSICMVEAKD
jgi:hypothetical protein